MYDDLDQQLLARSAHRLWERRVKAATASVRVFTPYLDRTLATLLNKAGPDIDLAVVTDLSPVSGVLDYAWQLHGVQRLLTSGVQVRSLRRLHAKVLLVDSRHATLGSQNFTRYGQDSKETTAAPSGDLAGSKFVGTLDGWFEEAEPVDLDFVERLLERLSPQMAQVRAARQQLEAAFDDAEAEERARVEAERIAERIAKDRERAKNTALRDGVRRAAEATSYRSGQTTAFARLDWDSTYEYKTLKVSGSNDLTTWQPRFGDRVRDTIRLQRYDFYPTLLGPSGRMAFVRVTRSRITYVWRSLRRGSVQTVAGERLWLVPGFPDDDLEDANMTVTARWSREINEGYQMRLKFDGTNVARAEGWSFVGNPRSPERLERAVNSAYADENEWRDLLSGVFAPVAVPVGFRKERNAATFFPEGWQRIDVTTFLDQPVLLVQPA